MQTRKIGIATTVESSDIWPGIVETEEWKTELGEVEDLNMDREIMDKVI